MTTAGLLRIAGLLSVFVLTQTGCGDDEETFTCGDDLTCKEGQICVERSADISTEYRCVENPCGSKNPSCDCAEAACDGFSCTSASEHTVSCVCIVC